MKNLKLFFAFILFGFSFILGGCYTQFAVKDSEPRDREYTYNDDQDQNYTSEDDSTYTENDENYYDADNDYEDNHYYFGLAAPRFRSYYGWYRPGINFGITFGSFYYDPYCYDPFYYSTWCSPYSFGYYPYQSYYSWYDWNYYSPYYYSNPGINTEILMVIN